MHAAFRAVKVTHSAACRRALKRPQLTSCTAACVVWADGVSPQPPTQIHDWGTGRPQRSRLNF